MNKYIVCITDDAYNDLACITKYIIEKYNDYFSAKQISDKLFDKCYSLSIFPVRSSKQYRINDRTIHSVHTGKYTILYYIDSGSHTVHILAITNSRRDITSLLNKRIANSTS